MCVWFEWGKLQSYANIYITIILIQADKAQKNKSPQQGTLFHKLNQNNTKFFHNQHKTQDLNTC